MRNQSLTRLPADLKPHLTAQMRLGSWGYANPFVRYTQRMGRSVALSAVGDYVYADNDYPFRLRNGNVTTIERRTNSRMCSGHAEVSGLWTPNDRSNDCSKEFPKKTKHLFATFIGHGCGNLKVKK